MMKIISFKICPFVQRVTALLEVKGVPYDIEYISLKNKPIWFQEISPNGQVPVLVTESSQALFESDAIVEYLNEIYGPLEAELTPEQRAFDRAWAIKLQRTTSRNVQRCGAITKRPCKSATGDSAMFLRRREKPRPKAPFLKTKRSAALI